jgi:hypothetical protein
MAKCCGHHLSDFGYKLIAYGWIILACSILVSGTIMTIVSAVQGNSAAPGLSIAGVLMMIAGGCIVVWWVCWKCKCGCCEEESCCELTDRPVYL